MSRLFLTHELAVAQRAQDLLFNLAGHTQPISSAAEQLQLAGNFFDEHHGVGIEMCLQEAAELRRQGRGLRFRRQQCQRLPQNVVVAVSLLWIRQQAAGEVVLTHFVFRQCIGIHHALLAAPHPRVIQGLFGGQAHRLRIEM